MASEFSFEQRFLKQIDWWIVGCLLALTAFGILVLDGTTYGVELRRPPAKWQMVWWAAGLVVFLAIILVDYGQLAKLALPAYFLCLLLLAGLLARRGIRPGGAASWYDLGKLRIQPSEFTKIAVILVISSYLARIKARLPGWADLAVVALLVLVPSVLIAFQPDFGTAIISLPLIAVLPWVAGTKRSIYVILAAALLVATTAYGAAVVVRGGDFPFLKDYQQVRMRAFFGKLLPSPQEATAGASVADSMRRGANLQPIQARIAIGSGRLWGRGWRQGTQTRLEFLPKAHTDYIFASCGEQFGFVGCTLVLALYALLVYRSILVALRSKDWLGYFIVIGVVTVFITHVVLNIGVATDLLPVTGLPLPFLSYGGSFLLATYIGFGLIVSVGMRRYSF